MSAQYGVINNDPNFFENASSQALQEFYNNCTPESLQHVNMRINPQSFLDILQLEIRGFSIAFSSKKKRDRNSKELLLENEIEILENELAQTEGHNNFENINMSLQTKKKSLRICSPIKPRGHILGQKLSIKLMVRNQANYFVL